VEPNLLLPSFVVAWIRAAAAVLHSQLFAAMSAILNRPSHEAPIGMECFLGAASEWPAAEGHTTPDRLRYDSDSALPNL
jgi:hypothetical protein